jgi:hypothetical protein
MWWRDSRCCVAVIATAVLFVAQSAASAAPLDDYAAASASYYTGQFDPWTGLEYVLSSSHDGAGRQRALVGVMEGNCVPWHDSPVPISAGAIMEVDPATGTMRADTLNNISFSGMSGYMCALYRVDAGESGLSEGDPTGLVFRTQVHGSVFTAAPHVSVIASSHVYLVTDRDLITLDRIGEDRAWHFELLGGSGVNFGQNVVFYSTGDPVPIGGDPWYTYNWETGEYSYDSSERLVTVHVGDSLLVTNFFWLRTGWDAAGNVRDADFWDTFASTACSAPGYEGVQLVPETLIIPEPASALLLASGASLLAIRRRRR